VINSQLKKIAVFTSGGDSPGMNACIRAVVRTAIYNDLDVWGIEQGYKGMIEGNFRQLKSSSVGNIMQKGGTILHSARCQEFRTKEGRKKAYDNLIKMGIQGLIAIGGDGTFKGAEIFTKEYNIPFIGCPGTIDNDLYGTDFTIGYDTAINTAMRAIDNIKDTAQAHNRLFFIEVMGRDAGFIALRSGIATGAEAVLIPEKKTNIEALISTLERLHKLKNSSSIVIVAEGDDEGGAFEIARKVGEKFKEHEIKVSVLGHIQRGGSPSCMDRVLASKLGLEATKALITGKRGKMVGQVNSKIVFTDFQRTTKHNLTINPSLLEMIEVLV